MIHKLFTLLILILISSVLSQATVDNYAATETIPICPNPNNFGWDKIDQSPQLLFDQATNYFDANGDSAPLFVKNGDGGSNSFKFVYYKDNTMTDLYQRQCTGTSAASPIKLINGFLFLKDAETYKLCKFSPAATASSPITTIILTLPTTDIVSGAITKFIPYHINDNDGKICIGITDGSSTSFHYYIWTSGGLGPLASTKLVASNIIPKSFSQIIGNGDLIYSQTDEYFIKISDQTQDLEDGSPVQILGGVVNNFLLRKGNMVIIQMDQYKKSANMYGLLDTVWKVFTTDYTSDIEYLVYSDYVSNAGLYGDSSLYWFHLNFAGNAYTYAQLPIDTVTANSAGSLLSVGFSGDKVTIIFQDVIKYWKIIGDDVVKIIYEKQVSVSLPVTGTYKYKLGISCLCYQIKKTSCFSSTLNCLIISKVAAACATQDLFSSTVSPQ